MRIGFVTGSISAIGSGRTAAVPIARGLSALGCRVFGLETTRLRRKRMAVEGIEVHLEPVMRHLAPDATSLARDLLRRKTTSPPEFADGLPPYDRVAGRALENLTSRLAIDVVYAFHNTNVSKLLRAWPHPTRLLAINLIGFGIDPTRGGAVDTFPLQNLIFSRPHWDLHVTATRFEYAQYRQVYERLEIDPEKLLHLPHSYDEEVFTPKMRAGHNSDEPANGPTTLLYPVNVYRRKNIELAIEVLSVVARQIHARLVVTGTIWDRSYHSQLLKLARDLGVGDRVTFLGGVPVERLVELHRQAAVTVYTSHQETFGHGMVESLACGTPVVGPGWILPCREVLEDAPGGKLAPKDANAFAAIVVETLRAEHDPATISAHARERYGNHSVAVRFLDACRLIKERKDRRATELDSISWKSLYGDAGNLL